MLTEQTLSASALCLCALSGVGCAHKAKDWLSLAVVVVVQCSDNSVIERWEGTPLWPQTDNGLSATCDVVQQCDDRVLAGAGGLCAR